MNSPNVLRRKARPTQSSYRDKVAQVIREVQGDLTDCELAERLGVTKGTIGNARNKKTNLCGLTLAKIGDEFGPESLAPFASLFGGICIPLESRAANDFQTIAGLSHLVGEWVERLKDMKRCHVDTAELADFIRTILPALTAVVDEADRMAA